MNGLAALVPATVEQHAAGAQELAIDQRAVSWGLVVYSKNCKQCKSTGFGRGPCMQAAARSYETAGAKFMT